MLLCVAGPVYSQNIPSDSDTAFVPYRLGIYGGLGTSILDDIDLPFVCGDLQDATGSEWNAGMVLDLPLLSDLTWHVRLGIARATGSMRQEGEVFQLRGVPPEIINGRVDQIADYRATGIETSLTGSTRLIDRLHGELGLGLWLRLHSEQTHRQVAVEPDDLLLLGGRREMEMTVGSLFDYRTVLPQALLGLRYDLPVGHDSYLSPEIRLSYPLMSRTVTGTWRSLQASIGASVRFGFPGARIEEQIDPDDTIPILPPTLVADILTFPEIVTVEITEYDSTDWVPVLNGAFFDEGTSTIPDRYHILDIAETSDFSLTDLTGSPLDVYHNVLNIIGLRMQRFPDDTIRIVGYRNSRESGQELSLQRAEAIRDYLVNTWDIFAKRISIEGGGLPPKPVPERTQEGFEENATARIYASNPNITRPIKRTYILRIATPPSVTFYPRAISQAGLVGWRLDVVGEEREWKSFEGSGALPDSIIWDWTSDSGSLPNLPIELQYRLTIRDSVGQVAHTEMRPIDVRMKPIQADQPDTLIESYSLLLFDYDSPEVSKADRELLQAIADRVKPGASIRFTGYTDSLGDETRNRQLGFRRAEAAANVFKEFAPADVRIIINDDGGERERFPFNLPEGRSYDRTVVIEVRIPTTRPE